MNTQLERFSLDGIAVFVEVVTIPGSEKTSGGHVATKAVNAFDSAQDAIHQIARKIGTTAKVLGSETIQPNELTVEFGVAFGTSGTVLIAGASIEASLKVTISYELAVHQAATAESSLPVSK